MQILREVQTRLDIAAVRPTCAGMTLTGTSARYELLANAELTSENVSGVAQIGTPSTAVTYTTAPDIAYSLSMVIPDGGSLTLDTATGEVTGTVAGTAQIETATVTAASGCTSNGTANVVVTGSYLTGSPITVPVALTTATHTTATLIATAIRAALTANVVIAAQYTVGGATAAFTLTDKQKRLDDATLNVNIPAGLGITAAASSTNTTAGVATCSAFRLPSIAWDQKDHEGATLATATKLYSILIRTDSTSTGDLTVEDGTSDRKVFMWPTGGVEQSIATAGNHVWSARDITFSASGGGVTIYIDIHAGT